jgi:transcriptional regulator with XRE-family HTH domain
MEPKEIDKLFSEFIRIRMERTNLNQSELARRTGVSQERISRIVNEESRISLHDFVILSSVLDPDFIRNFLEKAGKVDILCKLSDAQIYNDLNVNHPYFSSQMVQNMLDSLGDEISSHPFCRTLYEIHENPRFVSMPDGLPIGSFALLCESNGVRPPLTVVENANTNRKYFPMQSQLAEGHCAEGLY